MRLQGKTAIVTGGASGFGAGIVRKFIAEGARVMIADIDGRAARDFAASLGPFAVGYPADVSVDEGVRAMTDEAQAAFGHIDILVNNAGVTHLPADMEKVGDADFARIADVNMKAIFLTARHIVPLMKARKKGAILNMASTAAVSPRPRLTWYNASKGWIVTATRSMAIELAPFGIRVNALNPVAGETPLLRSFMGEDTPEMRAKFLSTIPLGRFSTPEDMGNAACYLCSDEASMVTGAALGVDGGRTI
jgi:3-oxoacyl-[acyl-carrier protein] reductase